MMVIFCAIMFSLSIYLLIVYCEYWCNDLSTYTVAPPVLLDHLPCSSCQTPPSMFGRYHWLAIEPLFAYRWGVLAAYGPPTEATRWSAMVDCDRRGSCCCCCPLRFNKNSKVWPLTRCLYLFLRSRLFGRKKSACNRWPHVRDLGWKPVSCYSWNQHCSPWHDKVALGPL